MKWWTRRQLNSRDPDRRKAALAKISEHPDSAMAELAAALNDSDLGVRTAAVRAVACSSSEQARDVLLAGLSHLDTGVREQSALALSKFSKEAVAHAVRLALRDKHAAVRCAAARTLEILSWQPENESDTAALAAARGDVQLSAQCGAVGVEVLLICLADNTFSNRRGTIAALAQTGDARAIKPLTHATRDSDSSIRVAALEALGELNDPATAGVFRAALSDADWHVRATAAESLGRVADAAAVDPLLKISTDPHWEVRKAAVEALVKINDIRAFGGLVDRLRDPDNDVRLTAAEGLGQWKSPQAIEPLVVALVDENGSVRRVAESALQRIDPAWEQTSAAKAAAVRLKAALKSSDYWVRQAAADIRGKIGAAEAATPIPGGLAHAAEHNRQSAVDIFIECLAIEDNDLRLAAIEALGRLGEARALPVVKAAAESAENSWVRAAAEAALPKLVRIRGMAANSASNSQESSTIVRLELWRDESLQRSN